MPLQPALSATSATSTPARNHFQFQFTGGTIEVAGDVATTISGRFAGFRARLDAALTLPVPPASCKLQSVNWSGLHGQFTKWFDSWVDGRGHSGWHDDDVRRSWR